MSPQSRANACVNTSFDITYVEGELSSNSCSTASSIETLATAATAAFELRGTETTSSNGNVPETLSRKRASTCLSSSSDETSAPFLASYGSAFLSGIFADIAEASEQPNEEENGSPTAADECAENFEAYLPRAKKSRVTLASSPGGRNKSYRKLSELVEGAPDIVPAEATAVVSPRSSRSNLTIKLFNDQVRELQNLAFPNLSTMPVSVSTSSCYCVTPRDDINDASPDCEQDSSSGYGWFVSTDDDENLGGRNESSATLCPSSSVIDLAFKANVAPNAENHDTEVQQALAADTIDDVLGDFF